MYCSYGTENDFSPVFYAAPMLPPITNPYKRKYEDEDEFDSDMDDFIDDEGEDQDEISKHIKEIFGYDRNRSLTHCGHFSQQSFRSARLQCA